MASSRTKQVDASGKEPGRVATCLAGVRQQWNRFLKFLWNPVDRTVLGRGGKSWGQIMIFYFFYYAFLAALFAIALFVVLGSLDPYTPRFQTRLQAPGVSIQPRLPSHEALNSDIVFKAGDSISYELYTKQLDSFFKAYGPQSDATFKNCTNSKVKWKRIFNGDEKEPACTFYPKDLGECAPGSDYGYNAGEPCILVKVNKIINWFPVGFTDLSKAVGNSDSNAPALKDVLKGKKYNPLLMYVACYGMDSTNQRYLNGEEGGSSSIRYFPDGIPLKYYPFYGNMRQPNYRTPVVAVKFTNVTKNQDIKVGCKAYAANIVDDARMKVGFYNFKLRINE